MARPTKAKADASGLSGLAALLERDGAAPVFLLLGEDRQGIDDALILLREHVLAEEGAGFNELRFRGQDHAAEEVVEACATLPLLGDRRLVIVREPERLGGDAEALLRHLADPPPSTCLVLVPTTFDRRLRVSKALEAAACTVLFAAPLGHELHAWVSRALADRGLTVARDALALLADLVEADTLLLGHELEKLALYCRDRGKVEREDVEALLGRTRTVDAWDLTNAIEDARPDRAVAALRRLLEQGATVPMLVGMLDWCLGRLVGPGEPKAPPGRRRALSERRRAILGRAPALFGLLRTADRLCRTTGGDAAAALERAVLAASR